MARDSVKIAATFLASFEAFNIAMGRTARPATVTRQDLVEWHNVCVNRDNQHAINIGCNPDLPIDAVEPTTGSVVSWPNFLTNPPKKYRVENQRVVFALPWGMLDEYKNRKDNIAAKRAQYAAALAATKANAPAPVTQPTPEDQIDQDIEEDFEEYDGDDNDTEDGDN